MSPLRRQLALMLAVSVDFGLAHIGTSTMPFQIGALVDGSGRSPAGAGSFSMLQVAALAVGMIFCSGWVTRVPPSMMALAGCLLTCMANASLYVAHAFKLQMALGALAGLGFGLVFAAAVATAAGTSKPDRVYGIGNGGALLIIVGVMANIPAAAAHFGPLGIFVPVAGLAAICAPFSAALKTGKPLPKTQLTAWRTPGAPGLLFSWAAFSLGTTALYAFSERIGKSIHLTPHEVAAVLSAGVLVGLIGTGATVVIGERIGRPLVLTAGTCGCAVSCLVLGYANDLPLFAIGVFTYWIFYMLLYSYLLGTAAILDPTGSVGALGGGCERLGYALGAGLGGVVAEHASYAATGLIGFVGCALGLAIGFPSLFRALRAQANPRARNPSAETTTL